MNLVIDAHNLRIGGGLTHLVNIMKYAALPGKNNRIYILGNRNLEKIFLGIKPLNAEFIHEPLLDRNLFFRIYWHQFRLFKILKKLKADVLFSPGALLPFRWPDNVRAVTMCRNMLPFSLREVLKLGFDLRFFKFLLLRSAQLSSFSRADGLIFVSEYAKREIEKLLRNRSGKRVLIYHGLGKDFRKKTGKPVKNDKVRILYISNIDVYKNQWNVVRALKILKERGYNNLYLKLVGSGYKPALKYLMKIIYNSGIEDKVKWKGAVPHNETIREYSSASIFVFASSCENCPNILLEAMASGLPIACSDSSPMPEFARNGARYFNPENPESIADALAYLIDNPKEASKLGRKAALLVKGLDWQTCARKTFDFISSFV